MAVRGFTPQEKQKLDVAAGIASSYFPYLGGIFAKLDVAFDDRIGTVCVTGSGKLLFDRDFFGRLAPGVETAFILAHEMLHLAQMIFERGKAFPDRKALNIAHDMQINELLCETMGIHTPPCGGLDWQQIGWQLKPTLHRPNIAVKEKAADYSLEELTRIVAAAGNANRPFAAASWDKMIYRDGEEPYQPPETPFGNNPFAELFADDAKDDAPSAEEEEEKKEQIGLDMIAEDLENALFPDEDRDDRRMKRSALLEVCRNSAAQNVVLSLCKFDMLGRGSSSGNFSQAVDIVRSCYTPPWQMAMQRWVDGNATPKRSYSRASRRGAWRSDVVLPGRDNECNTVHIVLDTSGSMANAIPMLLGQIAAFARVAGMEQLHLMQCDVQVAADDFVDIGNLAKYRVAGYGGSDMSPAMLKLAEDPEVVSVLVITDGFVAYPPQEKIPYDVLWCLPEYSRGVTFPYGKIVHVPIR